MANRPSLASSESISRELFAGGCKLAANRGLLTGDGTEMSERRRAFEAEIRGLVHGVSRIRALALEAWDTG